MNKWYRSAPCKGVLLVLEHLMASTAAVCLVWMMTCYMNGGMAAILDKPEQKYEDSKVFEEQLQGVASDIIWAEPRMEEFETEGVYDENKTVDLREFLDDETISGENKSGLAYRLGDLYEWGITGVYGNYGATADIDKKIIVCKREDGTYQYFYQDEFQKMLEDGSLRFSTIEEAKSFGYETQEEIFGLLLNGEVGYESLYKNLLDSDGRIAFTSFWLYDGYMVEETYKPLGVSNLVELVNTDPRWNGKLSEVMEAIAEADLSTVPREQAVPPRRTGEAWRSSLRTYPHTLETSTLTSIWMMRRRRKRTACPDHSLVTHTPGITHIHFPYIKIKTKSQACIQKISTIPTWKFCASCRRTHVSPPRNWQHRYTCPPLPSSKDKSAWSAWDTYANMWPYSMPTSSTEAS